MKFLIKKRIASFLKSNPRLFDIVKALSRIIAKNEIFQLLQEYSVSKTNIEAIQIGANDGISNDPLREFFVNKKHWRGYLLEPIPTYFAQLQRNYQRISKNRVSLIQSGISDHVSLLDIYQINDEFIDSYPSYAHQIASLDKEHLFRHFPELRKQPDRIQKLEIKVTTIAHLVKDLKLKKVDIICMDIEGIEYRVLKSFPFSSIKPNILIFEVLHLNSSYKKELYDLMKVNGYHLYEFHFDAIALQHDVCPSWQKRFSNYHV